MKRIIYLSVFIPCLAQATCNVPTALQSLVPGAEWNVRNDNDYNSIEWLDPFIIQPTADEVSNQIANCLVQEQTNQQRIANDLYNINLSSNTAADKYPYLLDYLQLTHSL